MIRNFTGYVLILLFSAVLTACGGGSDSIQYGANNPDNGNTPPPEQTPAPAPTPSPDLPAANQSVSLSWLPPLSYTDNSSLTDLQGHHIYMKIGTGNFVRIHTINSTATATYTVENLAPGTYTFAVTAYNSSQVESDFSNIVSVTL